MNRSLCLAALALLAAAPVLHAQSFQGLGFLDAANPVSYANDVSADGSVVVGYSNAPSGPGTTTGGAYRWEGSMQALPYTYPQYPYGNYAHGVSADGTVTVGWGAGALVGQARAATRWVGSAAQDVGPPFYSEAAAASADGSVVVGSASTRTLRWANGTPQVIEINGRQSAAHDVSADGAVMVGYAFFDDNGAGGAYRWENGVVEFLPGFPDDPDPSLSANGITPDGTIIVGEARRGTEGHMARWTNGVIEDLGPGVALSVSADGNVVVGHDAGPTDRHAVIWTPGGGVQDLRSFLVDSLGLDLTGWTLRVANAVSDDGTTIVGDGVNPNGRIEAWRAVLPPAGLTYTIAARPAEVAVGDTITVAVGARNDFAVPLTDVRPAGPMEATSEDGVEVTLLTGPEPATIAQLEAGASDTLRYTFVVAAAARHASGRGPLGGLVEFFVELLGTDPGGQTVEGTYECAEPPCGEVTVTAGLLVNSTDDDVDEDTEDGACDTGQEVEVEGEMVAECTLRAAIEEANAQPGADEVAFAIPGGGPHTIRPAGSALPPLDVVEAPVVLDATTQPGYAGTPLIFLDGSEAGVNASGFRVVGEESAGGQTTIKGFAIGRFGWHGIWLIEGSGNVVEDSYVGTDAGGGVAGNGLDGIRVETSFTATLRGNVVSANGAFGISLVEGSGHVVEDSYVGTDAGGSVAAGNGRYGIVVDRSSTATLRDNVVSANDSSGIVLFNAEEGRVLGNRIGTNADGTAALPNGGSGIWVESGSDPEAVIGGTEPDDGNLISGNTGAGVLAMGGHFVGNRIGTNADGTAALPNGGGVEFQGGSDRIEDNVISGNAEFGLHVFERPNCFGCVSGAENTIVGNRIGTNAEGTAALPNEGPGLWLGENAARNVVGGMGEDERNLISGNTGDGILLTQPDEDGVGGRSRGNRIAGNYIGTDESGTRRVPNQGAGVHADFRDVHEEDVTDDLVGVREGGFGPPDAPANVISGNLGPGVWVEGYCFVERCQELGVRVEGNYIGTDETGTAALGNGGPGVLASDGSGTVVGSNLVSANADGIVFEGDMARGIHTAIAYNLVGSDLGGGAPLGNLGDGIRVAFEMSTPRGKFSTDYEVVTVGSNTIAGNRGHGVAVSGHTPGSWQYGPLFSNVSVSGNGIGYTRADGGTVVAMGNDGAGVFLGEGSLVNHVEDNLIAYNGGPGVVVADGYGQWIRSNHIFTNGGLAIDLGGDGPTPNDRLDEDDGPNDLTNHPLFEVAYLSNGEVFVAGSMAGLAFTNYRVDLVVEAQGVEGFGEAQGYLGQQSVDTPLGLDTDDGTGQHITHFTTRFAARAVMPYVSDAPRELPLEEGWRLRGLASYSPVGSAGNLSFVSTSEFGAASILIEEAPKVDEDAGAGNDRLPLGGDGFTGSGETGRGGAPFAAGDTLLVCPACAHEEVVAVAAVEPGALVLTQPLARAHAAGEAVVPFARARASVLVTADTLAAFESGTAVAVQFAGVTGGGRVTVERFRRAPDDADGIAEATLLPHRWIAALDSTLAFSGATELRIALAGIPNLTLEAPEDVVVYHRPVPGEGTFEPLATAFEPLATAFEPLATAFDTTQAAFVASGFTALGEFALATDEDVDEPGEPEVPAAFALSAAYPNPFNPSATLTLDMPEAGQAAVTVYDALGRRVAVLLDGAMEAGSHAVRFEARGLPSGVYFVRALTEQGTQTRRVTLLR